MKYNIGQLVMIGFVGICLLAIVWAGIQAVKDIKKKMK